MSLLLPDGGLLFWMTIVFLVVFFILWRWGFPSIIKMVNERKNYIDESLAKAEEANLRLANIQKQGEELLMEAREKQARSTSGNYNQTDDYAVPNRVDSSGFSASNSGDDRLYDFQGSDYTGDYSAAQPKSKAPSESSVERLAGNYQYAPNIEVVNARFVDDNQDGVLSRNEVGKIIFEVMNRSDKPITDVQPSVLETSGNRHIYISPSVHIESIAPGKGVRYTAIVKADKRIKAGMATFAVTVLQGQKSISKVTEFNIRTSK